VKIVDSIPHRLIRVLTPQEVTELERRLGVRGRRNSNLRAMLRERTRYGDEMYDLRDEKKLEAWDATS